MSVIVYHAHARHPTAQLEAPVHSTELIERNADRIDRNIKPHSHRNRRRRIQNVVDSRHMQRELAQVLLAITHMKAAQRPACTAVRRRAAGTQPDPEIRSTLGSVRHRPPLDVRQQSP